MDKDQRIRKLVHPQQTGKTTARNIPDEEKANTEQIYHSIQPLPTTVHWSQNFLQPRPSFQNFSQTGPSSFKASQAQQLTITFGPNTLPVCTDESKKFRPMTGINLTAQQQCLLDNLWHIHTYPTESAKKVQILNSLGYFFMETFQKTPVKTNFKRFSHYIIFRGTKVGIFNRWETVVKHIQCTDPLYKGFHSFSEAMTMARKHFGISEFFIEPEEVKTFSEVTQGDSTQIIKRQEEEIVKLQKQILQKENEKQILQKENENHTLQTARLQVENQKLRQQIVTLENPEPFHRNFDSFKARIIDIPWIQTLKPVLDRIEGLDDIISEKVCTGFPLILYKLQQKIVQIAFQELKYTGIKVVERTIQDGTAEIETGILLLQLDLEETDMPHDLITQFYHYGMIDYIKFKLTETTEKIINTFGEKFTLVAGNIAANTQKVGCKIFASFPEADSHTYRPSRKRIFISGKPNEQELLEMAVKNEEHINFSSLRWLHKQGTIEINTFKAMITEQQSTPRLPRFFAWFNYRLMAEGHYTQIWTTSNWNMLLPFIGEGNTLEPEHINDNEETLWPNDEDMQDSQSDVDAHTIPTIDSNYRDF